jgi:cephalosporin-C deacetylase-like acetyl esterase
MTTRPRFYWRLAGALLAPLLLTGLFAQSRDELSFVAALTDAAEYQTMLSTYLKARAFEALDERSRRIAKIASAADADALRQRTRARIVEALGGFPERTPLNARIAGTLERPDHRIEKIVFESQPRFYVTANLYLPKSGQPPYPAILFPLGHEAGAKAHEAWQQILVSFARRGYVALAWDTIGQGERVQLYDEDFGESKVVRSTTEHTMQGIQCLLVGDSLARYTIWDGMRALDYLLSRKEVDASRVGVTGNSGGGTHTAYLAALDDRFRAAAPSCYITSWRRLLDTIGPQDAEQCLPPSIDAGLDHGDFIYAFAPKPYAMLTAIRDFFSIRGARETFAEAQRFYGAIGAGDKITMFEADDGHGYTRPRREASYRFFGRWLKGAEDTLPEQPVVITPEEDLFATETGQVTTSLGGETVFTLNRKRLEQFAAHAPAAPADVRKMLRFEPRTGPVEARSFGRLTATGYRIEKLIYASEPGISVPALAFVPEGGSARKPAVVWVDGAGKGAARPEIESLVKAGLIVLSLDVRGFGETGAKTDNKGSDWPRYFGDFDRVMTALLLGKPLVSMRAEDVARAIDLLAARSDVDPQAISAIGRGAGALPVLYAAAFDPRIKKVALDRMFASYESVVRRRLHRGVFDGIVQGALRRYDIADVVGWLAPRPVWIADALDPMGWPVTAAETRKTYARAADAFGRAGAAAGLHLVRRKPGELTASLYAEMLPPTR